MKNLLLLPLAIALPAYAGTSAKQVVAPPPDTCLTTWFAGASVGYLTQLDTAYYTAHIGVTNSCWKIAGWDVSLYAEVGYAEKDKTDSGRYLLNDYFHDFKEDNDLTIVPVTLNVKFDHQITGNLGAYLGGGLGLAWVNDDWSFTDTIVVKKTTTHASASDSDWVFCAQIFAGLNYHVTPQFEVYGGGRWIHLADPTLFGSKQSIDDDWLVELGARYKF